MNSRKPRTSNSILKSENGKYRRKTGKRQSCYLLRLVGTALAVAWVISFTRRYSAGSFLGAGRLRLGSSRGTSTTSNDANALKRRRPDDGHPNPKNPTTKSNHHKHHKHHVECTPSPLETREVFPKYGCDEIDEMLQQPTTFLGKGYWREVRLGMYAGQQVAIKTLRDTQEGTERNLERHRWEATALDALKDHPNIVHLLGLCDCDIVTEYFPVYMDNLILANPSSEETPEKFPDRDIIRMALDAARGLQALHELPGGPVVHADLQPRQLLLDHAKTVKVNDFNRSRFMGRDTEGKPCPFFISKGNGVWRAPEEYNGEPLTEKLDIYSMGMIFWAMLGRRPPFDRDSQYKDKVLAGERPFVGSSWHSGFVQLFQDMWVREPTERPTAGEVVRRLEKMASSENYSRSNNGHVDPGVFPAKVAA